MAGGLTLLRVVSNDELNRQEKMLADRALEEIIQMAPSQ